MDSTALLDARGVWKWPGPDRSRAPALRDVTLTVLAGSWTVVTGPSGCGKTTLLSLLGALDRPSRGQVLFEGRDLTEFSDIGLARLRRRIAFVFQDFSLIPRLPLWENVTYPLVPRGLGRMERQHIAVSALERVGLDHCINRRPEELSGGERQRAAIARALASDPELVIADEPTSSLDPETALSVRQSLLDLHGAGATVLLATHDPTLAAVADQNLELRGGMLVSDSRRD